MVNTQHSQNDAVKVAARPGHSAAQILQWPPSHPGKSRSPYSALELVRRSPPSHISKLKFSFLPHWSCFCNTGFLFLAPLCQVLGMRMGMFARTTEASSACILDVCGHHSSFGGTSSANYYYIYATYSDTPQALLLYVFFLPFSCSIND